MEVMALAAAAGVAALAGWFADRRRARARNAHTRCGSCATDLTGADTSELFLIQGRLICAACADGAKRKLLWQFVGLTGAVAFSVGMIVAKEGVVAMLAVPIGTVLVMTTGTVYLMKLANRRAQERIARGRDPAFAALMGDAPEAQAPAPIDAPRPSS